MCLDTRAALSQTTSVSDVRLKEEHFAKLQSYDVAVAIPLWPDLKPGPLRRDWEKDYKMPMLTFATHTLVKILDIDMR